MSPDQRQPRAGRPVYPPGAEAMQDRVALERWVDEGGCPAQVVDAAENAAPDRVPPLVVPQ